MRLRFKIWTFRSVAEKAFAPQWSSGLLLLRCPLLGHFMHNLERLQSFLFVNSEPSEQLNVLMKRSCCMKSQPLLTRMLEAIESMSSALDNVNRPKGEVHEVRACASVFRKRKCVEGDRSYLVRDGMCVFLRKVSERNERVRAAKPPDARLIGCWRSGSVRSGWRRLELHRSTAMCRWGTFARPGCSNGVREVRVYRSGVFSWPR